MTTIGKRMRENAMVYISDYPDNCMYHVGIVDRSIYEQAFFTDAEIRIIEDAKKLVSISSHQTQLEVSCFSVRVPLFASPVKYSGCFNFYGSPPLAWSKTNQIKDHTAYSKIEEAAYDVLQTSLDAGIFRFAAKKCLHAATSWEQLGASFPPFADIMRQRGEVEIASLMVEPKAIKPLPLQPHERDAVKYALNWCAIQNMVGGFSNKSIPAGCLRLGKASTSIQEVTFTGNQHEMSFVY